MNATPDIVEAARKFIAKKWAERAKELGREKPENTKTACKFASMFAHRVFGGTLEGNARHQYLRTADGHVLDLTDWSDESAYRHDASFFHNPEHAESMSSCKQRVDSWVAEFVQKHPVRESLLQEGKVRIEHWNEDMDDPWDVADKAEAAFRASGLRPMSNKELGHIAFDENDNPIGATYHTTRQQPAEDFGGPEDDFVTVFDFDVGVDPKHQGGVVGWMLCKAAIQTAGWEEADLIRNWVINEKMADMLERLFGFEHEGTPQHGEGYSTHMVKWLKTQKTPLDESIKSAATRYQGKIYTGHYHFECYRAIAAAAGVEDPEEQWAWVEDRWDDLVQDDGFITDKGVFLNREQAHDHAVKSKQVHRKEEGSLDSEDLLIERRADALIRSQT